MKTRLTIIILAVVFLAGTVFAQQRGMQRRDEGGFSNLNLTQEQKTKIADIRANHQKLMIDFKKELGDVNTQVRDMKTSGKIESDKLLSLTEKSNVVKGKIATSSTKVWLSIYNLLTDEQKTIFNKKSEFKQGQGRNFSMGENFRTKRNFGMGKNLNSHRNFGMDRNFRGGSNSRGMMMNRNFRSNRR